MWKYVCACVFLHIGVQEKSARKREWEGFIADLLVLHCQLLSQTETLASLWLDITRFHVHEHSQTHTLKGYYSQVQNPSERGAIVNQAGLRCKTDVLPLLQPWSNWNATQLSLYVFLRDSGSVKEASCRESVNPLFEFTHRFYWSSMCWGSFISVSTLYGWLEILNIVSLSVSSLSRKSWDHAVCLYILSVKASVGYIF